MKFMIESKYEVQDVVEMRNMTKGRVYDIKMVTFDNYFCIKYLIQFGDFTRSWVDERDIFAKVDA